jgi:hypothetical protein
MRRKTVLTVYSSVKNEAVEYQQVTSTVAAEKPLKRFLNFLLRLTPG